MKKSIIDFFAAAAITETFNERKAVVPVATEKKLVGKLRPQNGQKVYQLNPETKEVTEAEFDKDVQFPSHILDLPRSFSLASKLTVKEGYHYTTALNVKNAIKKFKKQNLL